MTYVADREAIACDGGGSAMYRSSLLLCALAASTACRDPSPGVTDAPPPMIDARVGAPDGPWLPDGTPTRMPCTNTLGHALTAVHGRLDGYLVAIVPVGAHSCNGDDTHVHLQVRASGSVYDVAVNVSDPANVHYLAQDMTMPDGPWSEGWHPGQAALLDYPTIGAHSTAFTALSTADLAKALDTELADVNHVSIFMTGYGDNGGHLVHRNGAGEDGAIVVRPLGASRLLMFHFAGTVF